MRRGRPLGAQRFGAGSDARCWMNVAAHECERLEKWGSPAGGVGCRMAEVIA